MISRPALGGTALQSSPSRLISWILTACAVLALCLHAVAAQAQAADPKGEPNKFVESVGNQALQVVKESDAIRKGDRAAILAAVNENIMPYVNLEKTTRLSAGRYWRQASPEQRQKLVDAFKGTSGAFDRETYRFALDRANLTEAEFEASLRADVAQQVEPVHARHLDVRQHHAGQLLLQLLQRLLPFAQHAQQLEVVDAQGRRGRGLRATAAFLGWVRTCRP